MGGGGGAGQGSASTGSSRMPSAKKDVGSVGTSPHCSAGGRRGTEGTEGTEGAEGTEGTEGRPRVPRGGVHARGGRPRGRGDDGRVRGPGGRPRRGPVGASPPCSAGGRRGAGGRPRGRGDGGRAASRSRGSSLESSADMLAGLSLAMATVSILPPGRWTRKPAAVRSATRKGPS